MILGPVFSHFHFGKATQAKMMRKVLMSRASQRVLHSSRALSTSVRSRVKIIGSDEAYTQIATVREFGVQECWQTA